MNYKIIMKNKLCFLFFIFTFSPAGLSADNLANYLVPVPKSFEQRAGTFNRNSGRIIIPEIPDNSNVLRIAWTLQSLLSQINIEASIAAVASKNETPLVWIYLAPELSSQSYRITIQSDQILLEGGDQAGLFYALQTFKQIVRYAKEQGSLPLVSIGDEPDFKRRGIMLDISRNKVPTMETLKKSIEQFSCWKINEIQLYTETTFAYQNHKVVWDGYSPMTAGEILELDQFCRERFIDLVPNQTSFGHMNQWLEHDQYKYLDENQGPKSGSLISPVVPGSLNLIRELYAELLPNFSSHYFNINCDETVSLGTGLSKAIVEEKGKGPVYLDYILQLKGEIDKYGRTTQFWGDIILKYPELIPKLPKDMIALIWGYEASYQFDVYCKNFSDAGCPFYVCPGTSSWQSLVGRDQNAFDNLKNAAVNGHKNGAMGYLITDWGDYGHWQPLSVSYPAFIFGASVSWGLEANQQMNIGKMVSRYIFDDLTGKSGQALIDIGNTYQKIGDNRPFHNLLGNPARAQLKKTTEESLRVAVDHMDKNLQILINAPMAGEDSKIVKVEMTQAVNMAKLACKIGLARFGTPTHELDKVSASKRKDLSTEFENLIREHQKIWVLRNRPGGLQKSVEKLEKGMMELQ
jgi:hexosaminidase